MNSSGGSQYGGSTGGNQYSGTIGETPSIWAIIFVILIILLVMFFTQSS